VSFHLLPDTFDFFFQTQPWYAIVQGLQSERVAVKPLQEAKERIQRGESKRQVAESLGMPESTLHLRLHRGYPATSLGRFKVTFSADMEHELVEHVKTIDNMFYGFTMKGPRALAFQFAQKNNISHRVDAAKQMAGKDWVYGFLKRHPDLSLKQLTATGIGRAIGFNKVQMKR
jgi:hypothetical protein